MLATINILKYYRALPLYLNTRNIYTLENPVRAGHSKWANIKHTKAQKDGQRAVVFTKLSRQIRLAVQVGGTDPSLNIQLKSVIEEAIRKNMPMSTIVNNIKNSQQEKFNLKQYRLGIRVNNVFAICVVYTDNFSRTKMEISSVIKKYGAIFVDVSHMFEEFGLIETSFDIKLIEGTELSGRVTNDAIECGAEDVKIIDSATGSINFICSSIDLNAVRNLLERRGYNIKYAEQVFDPKNMVRLTDEKLKSYHNMLAKLRDVAGLENVFDNVYIDQR